MREHLIKPLQTNGPVDIFFHSWDMTSITNLRADEHETTIHPFNFLKFLPEARGIFDSQDAFDASIVWDEMLPKNPLQRISTIQEERDSSLKNLIRSIESQDRAWSFYSATKTEPYDIVVAARPDVKFLQDLTIPPLKSGEIYVPSFHSWDGVNDRFALGGEEEIGVWLTKKNFIHQWISNGVPANSEIMTQRWLEKNNLYIKHLDFVFQRVRANEKICTNDESLI